MSDDIQPLPVIQAEIRDAWRTRGYKSSLIGRAVKELDKEEKIKGIYVFEYRTANVENVWCTGSPSQVWLFDGERFLRAAKPESIEQPSAIYTPTPIFFYCDIGGGEFVITWFSGGRAGLGMRRRLARIRERTILEPFGLGWHS